MLCGAADCCGFQPHLLSGVACHFGGLEEFELARA
jgi:hypothetical protein